MGLIIKTTGFEDFLDNTGGAWIKALILGAPDVGKTRSASFWPRPIYADCEDGRMSIADRGVPYARVRSIADMDALIDHLRLESRKPMDARKYLTFVVDTFDSYQRVVIQERLKAEKKESLSGWGDWGFLDAKMQQFVEKLMNLNMNIVVNLHEKDEKDGADEESRVLITKARLKGDIKDSIFQEFDLVGHMETSYIAKEGERVRIRQIRWHNEPKYPILKDRSGKLPRFTKVDFTENDYTRIFDAITAGVDDLAASKELETLAVDDGSVVAPGPDDKGGPVASPKLPKSPPAKKTAAKKTAVKKPAPEKAEPEKAAEPVVTITEKAAGPVAEEPAATEEEPAQEASSTPVEPDPSLGSEASPAADAPAASSEPSKTPEGGDDEAAVALLKSELGAEEVAKEPAPKAAVAPKAERAAVKCGDQPASMAKFPAYEGCGKTLNKENATRAQIAMLRTKTHICDDCFAKWKADSAK